MSHEVESMFSVGVRPWHMLGHVLKAAPSCAEALTLAGLNWRVELRPLRTDIVDGGIDVEVPSHRAVVRMDTGAVLGVVGEDFRPFQNADAFAFFEPLVSEGLLALDTAGSLRQGRRVWIMGKLAGVDPAEIVAGDVVEPFVLLCHGHEGSLALRVGFDPVRVVCQNTLNMALDAGDGLFCLRHTAGLASGLESIREALANQIRIFRGSVESWQVLAAKRCTGDDFERYALRVFGRTTGEGDGEVRKTGPGAEAGSRLLEVVRPLFESGAGNDAPGVRGTWWAAYNARTEWLTHLRGSQQGDAFDRAERRFDSLHFGDARKIGLRSLMLALEAAAKSRSATIPALPPGPIEAEIVDGGTAAA